MRMFFFFLGGGAAFGVCFVCLFNAFVFKCFFVHQQEECFTHKYFHIPGLTTVSTSYSITPAWYDGPVERNSSGESIQQSTVMLNVTNNMTTSIPTGEGSRADRQPFLSQATVDMATPNTLTTEPVTSDVEYIESRAINTTGGPIFESSPPLFPKIRNGVIKYGFPLVFCVGMISNGMSFLVILLSTIRDSSTGVYLAVLACADCLSLVLWTILFWAVPVMDWPFPGVLQMCNVRQFLLSFSGSFSAMCVVCVSLDRFIAVWFPFQAKRFTTRKRAAFTLSALFAFLVAIFFPAFFAFSQDSPCLVKISLRLYAKSILYLLVNIFQSYGIIISLVFLNAGIACRLFLSRKALRDSRHNAQQGAHDNRVVLTVVTVSVVYILCNFPFSLLVSLKSTGRLTDMSHLETLFTAFVLLYVANHGINFFIYVLTSANFRRTLLSLCRLDTPCRRRLSPPTTDTTSSAVNM